jgi:YVTN family beta-propeller protein
MAVMPPQEQFNNARSALREIVQEYGPDALSEPSTMSSLVADLLPGSPRIARILVAAAEDHIADRLRELGRQGVDTATASRLTASAFADTTMFAAEACAWVVSAFAEALGLAADGDRLPTIVVSPRDEPALPAGTASRLAPQRAPDELRPGPSRTRLAYVANYDDGTVTPIDVATDTTKTPIKVGTSPVAIGITPDGKTAYVTNRNAGTVTPIELETATRGAPIMVGGSPVAIAITPDGTTAYVANFHAATYSDGTVDGVAAVTPISLATSTPAAPIEITTHLTGMVLSFLTAIAVTPDGNTAYVASSHEEIFPGGGNILHAVVTPLRLATSSCDTPIVVGSIRAKIAIAQRGEVVRNPAAIAITPDGETAYALDSTQGTIIPIDLATGATNTPIRFENSPTAITITPDGTTAYVTGITDASAAGTVTPIDLQTSRCGSPIKVGRNPRAITMTPDAKTAYVAEQDDGTVTPIDLSTASTKTPILVGRGPTAIAVTR